MVYSTFVKHMLDKPEDWLTDGHLVGWEKADRLKDNKS